MNFGVIIRSIGERTEQLCYESVRQSVAESDIFFVKNITPSYNAYLKMFSMASGMKWDWFLAIDADVILVNNWYEIISEVINSYSLEGFYAFDFPVVDYVSEKVLYRGIHIYCCKYNNYFQKYMLFNKYLSKTHFLKKCFNHRYVTKPESSLEIHLNRIGLQYKRFGQVIGWHGYEQYYREIFRQFVVRFLRDKGFAENYANCLLEQNQNNLVITNDIDRLIANIAWNEANKWDIKTINTSILKKIDEYLLEIGFTEKEPCEMNIEDFYSLYISDLKNIKIT